MGNRRGRRASSRSGRPLLGHYKNSRIERSRERDARGAVRYACCGGGKAKGPGGGAGSRGVGRAGTLEARDPLAKRKRRRGGGTERGKEKGPVIQK